ncbi:DUF3027 domain-containing protein [Microbacterium sp. KHB019]|uniref:DUF3027 domain-containing protein n=1 Tax=Microbacterium sp. KHB019 TaxID=3129770 RepID=UPI00307942E8
MTSTPEPSAEADDRLIGAHDLALAALQEITPASTIGPAAGYIVEEDGSVSLRFENRLPGYPGWYWTVTVARVEDAEPTVLEVELLPNEGALLAPEWVPWAERLAEYRAHQAELAEQAAAAAAESGEDEGDDASSSSDDDDVDDDLDEDDEPDILHAGDLDGVDIDELDDSTDDDESDEDDSDESDEDDESDSDDSDEEE